MLLDSDDDDAGGVALFENASPNLNVCNRIKSRTQEGPIMDLVFMLQDDR
jgi:hypothetical protein